MTGDTYYIRNTVSLLLIAMFAVIAMSFLASADRDIDQGEKASRQDRLRVYCLSFPADARCLISRRTK